MEDFPLGGEKKMHTFFPFNYQTNANRLGRAHPVQGLMLHPLLRAVAVGSLLLRAEPAALGWGRGQQLTRAQGHSA